MVGNLDDISLQIGRMQSTMEEGTRQRDALFRKFDALDDKQTELLGLVRAMMTEHKALEVKHEILAQHARHDIDPHIASWREAKARAVAVFTLLAALGSSVGFGASSLFKSLFGGGN